MVQETPLINTDKHINVLDNPYVSCVCVNKAMSEHKAKKIHFSDCETEVLVGMIEARKKVLFGSHGAGLTNKRTFVEWQHVGESRIESKVKLTCAFSLK